MNETTKTGDWCICGVTHERDYLSRRLPCARFNAWSVPVSEVEITRAITNYHGGNKGRPWRIIHWNIALGKRIGTRT